MREIEIGKCEEFLKIVFKNSVSDVEAAEVIDKCDSFEQFRIMSVLMFAKKRENIGEIASIWHREMWKPDRRADANKMLHRIEELNQRQADLDRAMRMSTADLLEKLKALDTAAASQIAIKSSLEEIRLQLSALRGKWEAVDTLSKDAGGTDAT